MKTKAKVLVARESLQAMLNDPRPGFAMHVVGKALWALFQRQTDAEQVTNETNRHNSIGFTGADAYSGSLSAKYYRKHKRLEDWMVDKWTRKAKNGFARLTKYHKQLNEVALEKKNG